MGDDYTRQQKTDTKNDNLTNILPCLQVLCQGYMYAMQYPLTYLHVLAHKKCTYKKGVLFNVRKNKLKV